MAATHSLDLERSSSQSASIADASCPNLEISGSQTWECWIKPESFADFHIIMSKSVFPNTHDFYMGAAAKPVFRLAGLTTNTTVTYSGTLSTSVWVHIAGVYDSSVSKLRLYVNGELDQEVTASGSAVDTNGLFRIGANDGGSYYDGLIRNARVWNVARTQQQIRDNMNVDTPVGTGLQGNWILNNSYTDSSSNGYTLTASGSPVFSTTYPDAIDLVENQTFTKKHKITVQHTQVAGSANLTDVPIVFTESNFLSDIFTNSQGSEINTNKLKTDSNLKAYYRFESGALTTDSSGNGYTLTNNNTVGEGTGRFGGAADFGTGNTNKYLNVNNDMGITSGAITISLWVKPNSTPSGGAATTFFERGDSGTHVRHWIRYNDASGTIQLSYNRQRENIANDVVTYNVTLSTSVYTHLVLSYDGTTVRAYFNGVSVGSIASSGNGASGVDIDYTYIGCGRQQVSPQPVFFANALIDDVAVFNRALSAEEVRSLYAGGQDLRFSSDIDGKTRLAHEIVSFDKGTSKAEVWVKANTLDFDDNTEIYVHYGNATASALDENEAFGKHQVYPSIYKAVWHMGNATDSTSSSNDGTPTSVTFNTTNGKIVDGGGFDGTNSRITHSAKITPQGAKTIGVWIKKPSNPATTKYYLANLENGGQQYGIDHALLANGTLRFVLSPASVTAIYNVSTSAINDNQWYFAVIAWDGTTGSNAVKVYLDGVNVANATATATENNAPTNNLAIGQATNGTGRFSGSLDNLFMTNTALSADYILTIYNNQNSPSTFAIPSGFANASFLLNFV